MSFIKHHTMINVHPMQPMGTAGSYFQACYCTMLHVSAAAAVIFTLEAVARVQR
jgi:hypothetical protein